MRALNITALLLVAAIAHSNAAWACAACGCGDPTLTAMGVEKPFANRVRLSLEERFMGAASGDPSYEERTWTLRSSLSASWSPTAWLTVATLVPLVSVWVKEPQQPWSNVTGLGDVEASLRVTVFRNRRFSPSHLVSLLGGVKMPTGPRIKDDSGYPYPDDVQPGSGSWDPIAGAMYQWFGETASMFSSVSYRYTTPGGQDRHEYRRGQSLGGSVGLQVQPWRWGALALSADVRWAAADTLAGGGEVPNTGGTMLALTPAIVVSPTSNWLLKLSTQIHAADWLNGVQSESMAILLASVVDLR